MHVHITKSETRSNKGSSAQLVAYLEKENRVALAHDKKAYAPEYWFNHYGDGIQPYEVRQAIDSNVAKLSRDDAKFFLVNISPSTNELLFLKERYGEEMMKQKIKAYANAVMEAYAKNFRRDGVNGNGDLVYFGKLEHNRYYSYKDPEVRKGLARKGEAKPGEQMHVQVIVSRKDVTNSIKLSPLNNSKGANAAHSLKVGQFDRVAFKLASEQLFDNMFDYDRDIKESFSYANTMKNGSCRQRIAMSRQLTSAGADKLAAYQQNIGLIDVLFDKGQVEQGMVPFTFTKRKKKRRKGISQK